jgi:hypothetical protein
LFVSGRMGYTLWNYKIFKILLLLCVGIHCGIYKGFYNISNISHLNSPPLPFSFTSLPTLEKYFQTVSFFLFTFICTHFAPYSPS